MRNPFKKIILLLAIVVSLSLQSCIEIVEEVNVNDDQSGRISLSVRAGEQNPLLALLGSITDLSFMGDVKKEAQNIVLLLRQQEGISNVKVQSSIKSAGLELSFDFENSKALNEAFYAVAGEKKTFFSPNVYKIRKNKMVRTNTTTWLKLLLEQEKENLPDDEWLEMIVMKSVYTMPDDVKKVSSRCEFTISEDKNTVTTANYVSDILDQKINTRVKIKF